MNIEEAMSRWVQYLTELSYEAEEQELQHWQQQQQDDDNE